MNIIVRVCYCAKYSKNEYKAQFFKFYFKYINTRPQDEVFMGTQLHFIIKDTRLLQSIFFIFLFLSENDLIIFKI